MGLLTKQQKIDILKEGIKIFNTGSLNDASCACICWNIGTAKECINDKTIFKYSTFNLIPELLKYKPTIPYHSNLWFPLYKNIEERITILKNTIKDIKKQDCTNCIYHKKPIKDCYNVKNCTNYKQIEI